MLRIPIDDLDDPRIAVYRSLKSTNQTRDLDQFVVEGERLVARLLDSRFPIVSTLLSDRHEARLTRAIPEDVPVYIVSHAMIDRVVGFPFHRGILACGQRRPWPSLEEMVSDDDAALLPGPLPEDQQPGEPRRDRANRRCFRDRRDPRRPGMPRPALTPGAPRLDGRRTAAAGDRLAATHRDGAPTGPSIRFRTDRRRRRHRRRALRRRPQAPTARAGARRRARRDRPRVAGVLPDGHDPDASGRELAERRRGGRNTGVSLSAARRKTGLTGTLQSQKPSLRAAPRTADSPPNFDWLHANLDAQSPNPRVSCALPLSTGCLNFAIS